MTGSTNKTPVVIDSACLWVKPILVTEADILTMDDRTKRAILTHNKKWKANCEPGPSE